MYIYMEMCMCFTVSRNYFILLLVILKFNIYTIRNSLNGIPIFLTVYVYTYILYNSFQAVKNIGVQNISLIYIQSDTFYIQKQILFVSFLGKRSFFFDNNNDFFSICCFVEYTSMREFFGGYLLWQSNHFQPKYKLVRILCYTYTYILVIQIKWILYKITKYFCYT